MTPALRATTVLTVCSARVLVIGGTSGLGFGVAEALIEHHANHVIISSSNSLRLESAIDRLHRSYPQAAGNANRLTGIICKLGDEALLEENIQSLIREVSLALDGELLDHIVYTAGDSLVQTPLQQLNLQAIKQSGTVRFVAPLLIAARSHLILSQSPDSSFTLTAGAVADKPVPAWTAVSAFASGLKGMVRGLALEMKPVRVNLVVPGVVETEMWEGMWGGVFKSGSEARKSMFEQMARGTTTGRLGRVEDVVEAYLWSMKDGFASGAVVDSNGGALVM